MNLFPHRHRVNTVLWYFILQALSEYRTKATRTEKEVRTDAPLYLSYSFSAQDTEGLMVARDFHLCQSFTIFLAILFHYLKFENVLANFFFTQNMISLAQNLASVVLWDCPFRVRNIDGRKHIFTGLRVQYFISLQDRLIFWMHETESALYNLICYIKSIILYTDRFIFIIIIFLF